MDNPTTTTKPVTWHDLFKSWYKSDDIDREEEAIAQRYDAIEGDNDKRYMEIAYYAGCRDMKALLEERNRKRLDHARQNSRNSRK